jgi:hypothetical protein
MQHQQAGIGKRTVHSKSDIFIALAPVTVHNITIVVGQPVDRIQTGD